MIKKIKEFIGFILFVFSIRILEQESAYNLCELTIKEIEKDEIVKTYNLYKILHKEQTNE